MTVDIVKAILSLIGLLSAATQKTHVACWNGASCKYNVVGGCWYLHGPSPSAPTSHAPVFSQDSGPSCPPEAWGGPNSFASPQWPLSHSEHCGTVPSTHQSITPGLPHQVHVPGYTAEPPTCSPFLSSNLQSDDGCLLVQVRRPSPYGNLLPDDPTSSRSSTPILIPQDPWTQGHRNCAPADQHPREPVQEPVQEPVRVEPASLDEQHETFSAAQ